MGNSNAIQFSMGFDLSQLQTGAARAQAVTARAMGRIGATSSAAMGAAAASTVAVFQKIEQTARLASEKITGVFELGEQMQKLHERTSVATGRLYMMQRGLRQADVETEKLAPAMTRMQILLGAAAKGSKQASAALWDLGLTVDVLKKLSPDQQFALIAKSIGAIADPTARATAAASMFGRLLGGELMPLFRNAEALDMMGGKLDEQAKVFQKNSESFDLASKKLAKVGRQFQGFWVGMAGSAVGPILKALSKVQGADFVEKGKKMGDAIAPAITMTAAVLSKIPAAMHFFKAGISAGAVIGLTMVDTLFQWVERIGNALVAGFYAAQAVALRLVAELLDLPAKLVVGLASGLQWAFENSVVFLSNKMWDLIANIQAGFQFAIQSAFSKAMSVLPEKLKKMLGIEDFQPQSFKQLQEAAQKKFAPNKGAAEDFATIQSRNRAAFDNAMPELTQFIDELNARSTTADHSAQDAWAKATGDKSNPALEKTIEKLQTFAIKENDLGSKAWNKPDAEPEKKPEKKSTWTPFAQWTPFSKFGDKSFGPSFGEGGLSLGESRPVGSHIRAGADTIRDRRERQAALRHGTKPNKNQTPEGTNDRLDTLIRDFNEAWS